MAFCPNCGANLGDRISCERCAAAHVAVAGVGEPHPTAKHRRRLPAIAVAIVAVVMTIGAAVWFGLNQAVSGGGNTQTQSAILSGQAIEAGVPGPDEQLMLDEFHRTQGYDIEAAAPEPPLKGVYLRQGDRYGALVTRGDGAAYFVDETGAVEADPADLALDRGLAVGMTGWEAQRQTAGASEECVPSFVPPAVLFPLDAARGIYMDMPIPADAEGGCTAARSVMLWRLLGPRDHTLAKDESIAIHLRKGRLPVDGAPMYEIRPVVREGVLRMLITDPSTGAVSLGTAEGLRPLPANDVVLDGSVAVAAIGYETLSLGDLANNRELDAQWQALLVPLDGGPETTYLEARSPTKANQVRSQWVYAADADTLTDRVSGEQYRADNQAGHFVSTTTGQPLPFYDDGSPLGWRPGS